MRDEFSKHRCPGQEWRRLLEAAEKMVSRSFLCLGFVMSQSVIVSRTACLFCWAECVVCVVVCVIKKICPHYLQNICNVDHFAPLVKCVWQSSALLMAQGPQRWSLAMSGARLLGWLACGGFQTLLVLMMLSAE